MSQVSGVPVGWQSYNFSVPLFFLNPRLGVVYQFGSGSVFASAAYTSREPVLSDYYNAEFFSEPNFARNADGSFDFTKPLIQPEHLLDLELGTTFDPLDRARISLNGYYMGFQNEIVKTGKSDHFGSPIVANADRTVHYGAEIAAAFKATSWLELGANLTLSHNEILSFNNYSVDPAVNDSLVGHQPIGFPSQTGALTIAFGPYKGITLSGEARYVGPFYGDIENTGLYRNAAYMLVNATLSYRTEQLLGLSFVEVKISGMNLTNALYTTYVEKATGFFVGAPFNVFGQLQIGL